MYRKSGKLKIALAFKEPGKPELYTSKPGKRVTVDRHNFDLGMFVIWATSKRYAVVSSSDLHDTVEFDTPILF